MTAGSTRVEVTLERDGDATLLTLEHHGLTGAMRDAHAEGWTHYLARLARAGVGVSPGRDPWLVDT